MSSSGSSLQAISDFINQIQLIDTHEHLCLEEDWVRRDERLTDFSMFFIHYASVDVVSAGLPPAEMEAVRGPDLSTDEKWQKFEPYWHRARNTAYCKAVDRAIRDLYGLDGLSRDTYVDLSKRMREAQKPGWYRTVLKEKAGIDLSILDSGRCDVSREFFQPVQRFDNVIMARTRANLLEIERQSDVAIHSLDHLLQALDRLFELAIRAGAVAVKTGIAYLRSLQFDYVTKAEAEAAFARMVKDRTWSHGEHFCGLTAEEAKSFSDFLFHQVLQRTMEAKLPMQIHTGIQEGNGNYLEHSNPLHLTNVFMMYPEARFDIFHAGYPYWAELGVLGKMFPGVYADLCWAHIVSPSGARRALSEWLELMPASKIFGFGGDFAFAEGAYAHSLVARENVARVLAGKVDEGYFGIDEAERVARMILRDNAREFFKV